MSVVPFLKWAGGKRWLARAHQEIFNVNFNRYIEPFLGSGSVFFFLTPDNAILSDKNKDLVDAYRALKKDWGKVLKKLKEHSKEHSFDHYYKVRSSTYKDEFSRAAQFIYLNRTCWNGLYRVNRQGQFNVPKGTKDKVLLETDDFKKISDCLKNTVLKDGDFEAVIEMATEGDLLFVDPPYTVNHNKNGFLKYNEKIFSWQDQQRLSRCVIEAKTRGANVILTNADHESVKNLYSKHFNLISIPRSSILSGKSEFRGKVSELLVL
jgi:DNA adenine methylase